MQIKEILHNSQAPIGTARIILVLCVFAISAYGCKENPDSAVPTQPSNPKTVEQSIDGFDVFSGGDEVRDSRTGLIWSRCSVGQSWSGTACEGIAKQFTAQEAQKISVTGWRLPNIRELSSLISCRGNKMLATIDLADGLEPVSHHCEDRVSRPATYTSVFPMSSDDKTMGYWSSSMEKKDSKNFWYVSFFTGTVNVIVHEPDPQLLEKMSVRLVRSGR
ncbi:MAG: hypothetical protein RIS44_1742 [Pseudomonadota bacterium]